MKCAKDLTSVTEIVDREYMGLLVEEDGFDAALKFINRLLRAQ